MKKIKLIYIHQYFTFPEFAGGTRSYDLSMEFIQKGIDVTMVTTSSYIKDIDFVKRWTYLESNGLKIWVFRNSYSQKMSVPKRLISFFEFVLFSTLKIFKMEADLVLATSTPLTIAIPAIIKKWVSKTPFIFEVRDVWPEGPIQQGYVKNKILIKILRKIEKFVYNQTSYLVPLSVGMKKDILSRVNVENIEVIPNISELNRFQDKSNKVGLPFDVSNKKIILYAGTLGTVNDIIYLAKLAERTIKLEKNVVFLIIGDGNQKEMIVEYCKNVGILNKNIFFMNPIPKNALPYIYSIATMGSSFVWDFKIKWDNSANKFFDSLASGTPILINYQGWQAEVIRQKKCGFILSPKPTDEEVNTFVLYLKDEETIKNHGKNALIAAEEFSLENAVLKYIKVINKVVKNEKKA